MSGYLPTLALLFVYIIELLLVLEQQHIVIEPTPARAEVEHK